LKLKSLLKSIFCSSKTIQSFFATLYLCLLGVSIARNANGYALGETLGFSRRVKPKALLLVKLRVSPIVKLLALAEEQSLARNAQY